MKLIPAFVVSILLLWMTLEYLVLYNPKNAYPHPVVELGIE